MCIRTILKQDEHVAGLDLKACRVIQSEGLAVCLFSAFKQLHHYFLGWYFKVYTDHTSLQLLLAQKICAIVVLGWATQEYDFTITYKKGRYKSNVDTLSWSPCATNPFQILH